MYLVNDVKTWESPDGGGFSGALLRAGKLVGIIRDDGQGGGAFVEQFINKEEEILFNVYISSLPDVITRFVDHKNPDDCFSYVMNSDTYISVLVDKYINKDPEKHE